MGLLTVCVVVREPLRVGVAYQVRNGRHLRLQEVALLVLGDEQRLPAGNRRAPLGGGDDRHLWLRLQQSNGPHLEFARAVCFRRSVRTESFPCKIVHHPPAKKKSITTKNTLCWGLQEKIVKNGIFLWSIFLWFNLQVISSPSRGKRDGLVCKMGRNLARELRRVDTESFMPSESTLHLCPARGSVRLECVELDRAGHQLVRLSSRFAFFWE